MSNEGPLGSIGRVLTSSAPETLSAYRRASRRGCGPPARPALAVKVENTPEAQPLAGLNKADVIFEEVVEGGITRFIAVFHCRSTRTVGPVRSARSTDPKVLIQLSDQPLLAYSGAASQVTHVLEEFGTASLTESSSPAAFTRDEAREIPHNLFANTAKLWKASAEYAKDASAPQSLFSYGDIAKPNRKVSGATISFPLTAAEWRWDSVSRRWVRYLDNAPMTLEDGSALEVDNVVIQQVETTESNVVDVAGYPSPEVSVTGTGKAWLLRDGKVIFGNWSRPKEGDVTTFATRAGEDVLLTPGTTFVELAPTGMFTARVSMQT